MLLATQNELYKGCEAVIDILVQAALSISVESIVESWISVIEHHSSKSRPLSNDALDAEMMIALNGPSIVHCSGIVKESMSAYWKQMRNANLHASSMSLPNTGGGDWTGARGQEMGRLLGSRVQNRSGVPVIMASTGH